MTTDDFVKLLNDYASRLDLYYKEACALDEDAGEMLTLNNKDSIRYSKVWKPNLTPRYFEHETFFLLSEYEKEAALKSVKTFSKRQYFHQMYSLYYGIYLYTKKSYTGNYLFDVIYNSVITLNLSVNKFKNTSPEYIATLQGTEEEFFRKTTMPYLIWSGLIEYDLTGADPLRRGGDYESKNPIEFDATKAYHYMYRAYKFIVDRKDVVFPKLKINILNLEAPIINIGGNKITVTPQNPEEISTSKELCRRFRLFVSAYTGGRILLEIKYLSINREIELFDEGDFVELGQTYKGYYVDGQTLDAIPEAKHNEPDIVIGMLRWEDNKYLLKSGAFGNIDLYYSTGLKQQKAFPVSILFNSQELSLRKYYPEELLLHEFCHAVSYCYEKLFNDKEIPNADHRDKYDNYNESPFTGDKTYWKFYAHILKGAVRKTDDPKYYGIKAWQWQANYNVNIDKYSSKQLAEPQLLTECAINLDGYYSKIYNSPNFDRQYLETIDEYKWNELFYRNLSDENDMPDALAFVGSVWGENAGIGRDAVFTKTEYFQFMYQVYKKITNNLLKNPAPNTVLSEVQIIVDNLEQSNTADAEYDDVTERSFPPFKINGKDWALIMEEYCEANQGISSPMIENKIGKVRRDVRTDLMVDDEIAKDCTFRKGSLFHFLYMLLRYVKFH